MEILLSKGNYTVACTSKVRLKVQCHNLKYIQAVLVLYSRYKYLIEPDMFTAGTKFLYDAQLYSYN